MIIAYIRIRHSGRAWQPPYAEIFNPMGECFAEASVRADAQYRSRSTKMDEKTYTRRPLPPNKRAASAREHQRPTRGAVRGSWGVAPIVRPTRAVLEHRRRAGGEQLRPLGLSQRKGTRGSLRCVARERPSGIRREVTQHRLDELNVCGDSHGADGEKVLAVRCQAAAE